MHGYSTSNDNNKNSHYSNLILKKWVDKRLLSLVFDNCKTCDPIKFDMKWNCYRTGGFRRLEGMPPSQYRKIMMAPSSSLPIEFDLSEPYLKGGI